MHLNSLLDKVLERNTFLSRRSGRNIASTVSIGTMTDHYIFGSSNSASSTSGAIIVEETESQEATQRSEYESNYNNPEESKVVTAASIKKSM